MRSIKNRRNYKAEFKAEFKAKVAKVAMEAVAGKADDQRDPEGVRAASEPDIAMEEAVFGGGTASI